MTLDKKVKMKTILFKVMCRHPQCNLVQNVKEIAFQSNTQ